MATLGGGGGNGGLWNWDWKQTNKKTNHKNRNNKASRESSSVEGSGGGYKFPLKQAVTAGSLALTGDTIAQLQHRFSGSKADSSKTDSDDNKDVTNTILPEHDWLRALRMTSYGFFFYGPGSYSWYQFLDRCLPVQNAQNLMLKVFDMSDLVQLIFFQVLLNQIILGPCVIAVVFAWNNLWQGKLAQLPAKYQKDALPTLLYGFRFWIPVSALNFWVVPLQARVAFMSMGSIFWNFCLSSTMHLTTKILF